MVSMPPAIGSLWTVYGTDDRLVLLVGGPFGSETRREYLVVPVYSGNEPGFIWTDEDVLIRKDESPVNALYAAIWNTRPVLESDLMLFSWHSGNKCARSYSRRVLVVAEREPRSVEIRVLARGSDGGTTRRSVHSKTRNWRSGDLFQVASCRNLRTRKYNRRNWQSGV